MRTIAMILLSLFLFSGCADNRPAFSEHDGEAAMKTAARFAIQVVDPNAGLSAVICALPQERDMEQTVADRFVEENGGLLADNLSIAVTADGDLAQLDIGNLPTLPNAAMEEAFLDALARTMTQFPHIARVRFLFDGETLDALPNGTRCFGEFVVDESG